MTGLPTVRQIKIRAKNIQELFPLLGVNTAAMQSIARSLHRVQEQQSSAYPSRLEKRAVQLAEMCGVLVYVSDLGKRSKRRWTLYIYTEDGRVRLEVCPY